MQSSWKRIKLREFATVKYGKATPQNPGTVPVIGSGGTFASTFAPLVNYPTLIVGRKGTAGKVWFQQAPSWPSDTTFYLEWKNSLIDSLYLYYVLQGRPLSGEHARTTMPSIQRQDLEDYELFVPPMPEQKAIANSLRTVQLSKEMRRRELVLERERKAALMEYIFARGTRGQRTKQSEIGEIPESWQAVPLSNVCKESAFGPRFGAKLYSDNGNVAVLRTTDLDDDGNIDYATVPRAQLELQKFKAHLLEPGDFLITRSGTCGIASVFQGHSTNVLPGAFLIRFRLSSQISPEFLRHYINSTTGRRRVQKIASGAIQQNLTSTSLLNLCIPVPPLDEQETVNQVAACCNGKIWAVEREMQLLDELFRGMLEELMTGRLSAVPFVEEHEGR